ncbi:MAG: carbon storage regulator CsrA [Sporomusaceae bacterium]|nr:carbon storage regulator CsrA [Sporomusaceae bacterium]
MLVLTRRPGERINIGGEIVLTIVEVKGDTVRVAIDAPRSVSIFRGELYDSIAEENKNAAMPAAGGRDFLGGLKTQIPKK